MVGASYLTWVGASDLTLVGAKRLSVVGASYLTWVGAKRTVGGRCNGSGTSRREGIQPRSAAGAF
jgi:hypothetical protein